MIAANFQQFKIGFIVKGLTYIIGMLSFVAICIHVNVVYSLLFITVFVASFYFEVKGIRISRWMLNVLSLTIIAFFLYILDTSELVTQTMEALLILLGIKFLEQKEVRDYMQIYAISLFLLSGLGLLSLGIVFLVYILLFIFLLSTAFVFLTYYAQDRELEFTKETLKRMVLKSLWIPVLAIPLSAAMFVILPRSQYPILDFLNRPDRAKTGFTDNVRLGEVSGIQEDTSIIFRAGMERVNEMDLYWRGITLDYFNGSSWSATARKPFLASASSKPPVIGRIVKQTIFLEPYQNSYLFSLDKPLFVLYKNAKKLEDLTFTAPAAMQRRIRYEATSAISGIIYEDTVNEKKYLQLPKDLSHKVIALTYTLVAKGNPEQNAKTLLRYLSDGQYKYSLEHLPISKNPLEAFLFESKYGNCEYFASALAVMLRVAGVPSRLVGGYRGGYYNDVGGYYIIPQKNAHVWVEAFIPSKGWMRFDPTPASTDAFALPVEGNIFLKMSIFFDTINYYWNTIIINYNFERQLSIAGTVLSGFRKPSFRPRLQRRHIFIPLIVIGSMFLIAVAIKRLLFDRKRKEQRILDRFLRKMEKEGYKKRETQGLEEFVLTIEDTGLRTAAHHFVTAYEKIYYRDRQFDRYSMHNLERLFLVIPRSAGRSNHS